jgi:NAD(P)-dependent dehydrogenase (short-subunit alcohol dehydrogenase family)
MIGERRIAIAGGNRGMGFETCRQLGSLGYKIVLTSRERALGEDATEKLITDRLDVEPFRLDLTRAEDIAALVVHVQWRLGRVDVLVNNAGLYLEIAGPAVRDRTSVFDAPMEVVRAKPQRPAGLNGK